VIGICRTSPSTGGWRGRHPPGTPSARIEAFFSRWKRVLGDALRFRTEDRRNTEIAIAVRVLNRRLDLGRPDSVRVA
jgi:hypothetical protein